MNGLARLTLDLEVLADDAAAAADLLPPAVNAQLRAVAEEAADALSALRSWIEVCS